MCEVITATAGLAAVSGVTKIAADNTARQINKGNENAKRIAVDDQINENRSRATKDYLREVRLENLQETQETEAITEKSIDVNKAAAVAKGTAVASAAERGVAGVSLDSLISDFDMQSNQETGRLRINQAMKDQQHEENIKGYGDQFVARATAVKPYVPRPQAPVDFFGPILGIATAGLGAYAKTAVPTGTTPAVTPAAPQSPTGLNIQASDYGDFGNA